MNQTSILTHLHALDLNVQALIDARLRSIGLTAAQWRALDAALDAPGSSSAELARHCGVSAQSMQAIVATLETDGLLVRQPHPVHGRVLQIYVSNAGELRHAEGSAVVSAVEEQLLATFSSEERAELARLLAMMLGSVRRRCAERCSIRRGA